MKFTGKPSFLRRQESTTIVDPRLRGDDEGKFWILMSTEPGVPVFGLNQCYFFDGVFICGALRCPEVSGAISTEEVMPLSENRHGTCAVFIAPFLTLIGGGYG